MSWESFLCMLLRDFQILQLVLFGMEFVDVLSLVNVVWQIKLEVEIGVLCEICGIGLCSFVNVVILFYEGQMFRDVFRVFKIDFLKNGVDDVFYFVGGVGQGGYGDVIFLLLEQLLCVGDVFMFDIGVVKNGYFCDFDWNFVIGLVMEIV